MYAAAADETKTESHMPMAGLRAATIHMKLDTSPKPAIGSYDAPSASLAVLHMGLRS